MPNVSKLFPSLHFGK